MSTLQERLRRAEWYCRTPEECMGTCNQRHASRNLPNPDDAHEAADALDAAEAKLAAIDAYVVQLRQEGGPVCDTIARHLTEFLNPEEGTDE